MRRKNTVLLLVDQRARDAQGILLVYYFLKQMGCRVQLSNKRNMLQKYERFEPNVVAFSDTGTYFSDWCRYMSKKSQIVLIPQEGAIPERDMSVKRYIINDTGSQPFTKGVAKVFIWGSQTASWLLEEEIFREDQIVVSGTPRLDVYRSGRGRDRPENGVLRIGFANRGESVNMVHDSMIQRIDNSKYNRDGVEAYTGPDRNWEDWIWHSVSQLRLFFILIEKLSGDQERTVLFRPDPFENFRSYDSLVRKYPNFHISSTPFLVDFIDAIDVLVTEFSTTGMEFLIQKKPVISIQKIIGPRLRDHNNNRSHVNTKHMKFYWQPETIEEALEVMEQIARNELSYCPEVSALEEYLKLVYDWPRLEPSSLTIAREIYELLEQPQPAPEITTDDESGPFPAIAALNKLGSIIPFMSQNQLKWIYSHYYIFDLVRALRNRRSGKFDLIKRTEFSTWNRSDFKIAKKIFQELSD